MKLRFWKKQVKAKPRKTKAFPEIRRIRKNSHSTLAQYRLVKRGKGDFLPDRNRDWEYAVKT